MYSVSRLAADRLSKGWNWGTWEAIITRGASWGETYCQTCNYLVGKTCRRSSRIFCLLPSFRSYHGCEDFGVLLFNR